MGRISMPQGKGSQMHNRRDYESIGHDMPDNIDRDRIKDNVVLVDMDIREAYQDIFGDAVERYNGKQKRDDRKITDYYDKIEHSKNGEKLFYEDVLQWGKKEDFENNEPLREKAKDALQKYAENFQERNPNLRVIGAYIHMDEASPHLHFDYVPVAHGYKRGMDTRNSLDKALEEQGIEVKNRKRTVKDKETGEEQEIDLKEGRYNNRTMAWKEREREYFEGICQELGLEVEQERNLGRKQLTVAEYKEAQKQMIEPLMRHAEALKEGGDFVNEQGEREYIGYEESIQYLEKEQEHLSENAFAYRDGGWFYDFDKMDGFQIPKGGIEKRVKEANDQYDQMIERVKTYESDSKAQIDLDIQKYAQEQKKAVQGELDALRGILDRTRDSVDKNNGIIRQQGEKYQKNKSAIEAQKRTIEQLEEKAASMKQLSQSFDQIADRVPEHPAPEPVVKARKVIDQEKSFFREEISHNEYSVSIPASSLEEARAIQREIGDLYIKQYTKEAFKDVSEASERQAKEKADRMIAEAQRNIDKANRVLREQQQILERAEQQARQIKEKAEQERASILEQAKQKAHDIVTKAQDTLKNIKDQIGQLLGKRDLLQEEVDNTIEDAQLKAEAIIQEAHEQAGTDKLYAAINKRLGIVPMHDVAMAKQKVLEATEKLSDVLDDNDYAMIDANDAKGVQESLNNKIDQFHDRRAWGLRSAMEKYQEVLNAPHDPEDVLKQIEHTMNRSTHHHISR